MGAKNSTDMRYSREPVLVKASDVMLMINNAFGTVAAPSFLRTPNGTVNVAENPDVLIDITQDIRPYGPPRQLTIGQFEAERCNRVNSTDPLQSAIPGPPSAGLSYSQPANSSYPLPTPSGGGVQDEYAKIAADVAALERSNLLSAPANSPPDSAPQLENRPPDADSQPSGFKAGEGDGSKPDAPDPPERLPDSEDPRPPQDTGIERAADDQKSAGGMSNEPGPSLLASSTSSFPAMANARDGPLWASKNFDSVLYRGLYFKEGSDVETSKGKRVLVAFVHFHVTGAPMSAVVADEEGKNVEEVDFDELFTQNQAMS
tara:strand:- start:11938 stop:12888 length:951 start_codon:yes stop_codon:yes gene_type:complete